MMDPEIEAEALLAALQTLESARASDVADWIGRPAGAVMSVLKDLEKRGRTRRTGEFWSVVVSAPVASASPTAPRAYVAVVPAKQPAAATSNDEPSRAPIRRIAVRSAPVAPAPVVAPRVDRRRNRDSPKLALIDANRDLLGTMPDTAVAAKLGVSIGTIRNYRASKGLVAGGPSPIATSAAPSRPESGSRRPKASPKRALVEANRDLVGVIPDTEIAVRLGISMETVRNYRIANGIAAASKRHRPPVDHVRPRRRRSSGTKLGAVAANHHLLGTMTDAKLAEELGVSLATVARYRSMIGLPARKVPATEAVPASPTPKPVPGTPRVRRSPKLAIVEQNRHLLGTMSDLALAKKLGVSDGTIYNFRAANGLTTDRPRRSPEGEQAAQASAVPAHQQPGPKTALLEANRHLLGTMSDAALARQLGLSKSTIHTFRAAQGLTGGRSTVREESPAVTTSATVPVQPQESVEPMAERSRGDAGKAVRERTEGEGVPASSGRTALEVERQPPIREATPSAPAPILDVYLWTVGFSTGDTERTVVARTIEEAAQLATDAFRPRVTSITLLGEAILRGGIPRL